MIMCRMLKMRESVGEHRIYVKGQTLAGVGEYSETSGEDTVYGRNGKH